MKAAIGVIAFALYFLQYIPYIIDLRQGRTKPHAVTWLARGVGSLAVVPTMLAIGAGWAVVEGAGNLICGFAFGLLGVRYLRRGQHRLGPEAYVTAATTFGLIALLVLGLPAPFLMAMGVASAVAFVPTVRKCWADPLSEDIVAYGFACLSNALSIVAAHSYSLGTIYLPSQWTLIQAAFCAYLLIRRHQLGLRLIPTWNLGLVVMPDQVVVRP